MPSDRIFSFQGHFELMMGRSCCFSYPDSCTFATSKSERIFCNKVRERCIFSAKCIVWQKSHSGWRYTCATPNIIWCKSIHFHELFLCTLEAVTSWASGWKILKLGLTLAYWSIARFLMRETNRWNDFGIMFAFQMGCLVNLQPGTRVSYFVEGIFHEECGGQQSCRGRLTFMLPNIYS